MDKIMKKLNKLSLPATILIASLILGGFYYASEVSKQRSIERQQEVKIEQKKQQRLDEAFKEKQAKEESETKERINQMLFNACIGDAFSVYNTNWANSCKTEAQKISTGYQNCVDSGTSASSCKLVWGTADASENCSLRANVANRWDELHQKEKDACFKKYPQN